MRPQILPGLIGLVCGILGTLALEQFFDRTSETSRAAGNTPAHGSAANRRLQTQLDAAETQIRRLKAAEVKLNSRIAEVTRSQPPPTPAQNPMSPLLETAVKSQMRRMSDDKLAALKKRLQLSPEQAARLKVYFDDQAKRTEAMTSQILAGRKVDQAAQAQQGANSRTEEQAINEILTPAQKEQYRLMQEEERVRAIETSATFELNQMTPILGLGEEQKDRFFDAVAAVEQELTTPAGRKKFMAEGPAGDPARYLKARDNAKLEAVKAILTTEQWELYRDQLESRAAQQGEMLKALLSTK